MRKLKTYELKRKSVTEFKKSSKLPIVVVLDDIRSMYNVGSIFRTCDCFLIQKIILCGITPKPPHREITKTAIGATESMDWEYEANIKVAINSLKAEGYKIIGLEHTDESYDINNFEIKNDEKYALVLGNEVKGINISILEDLDECLEIPQYGTKHSLNVSIAGGISIYHFAQKLREVL